MKCKECGQELKGLARFKAGQVWEVDGDFAFIYSKDGELYCMYWDGSGDKVEHTDYLIEPNNTLNVKLLYNNPKRNFNRKE